MPLTALQGPLQMVYLGGGVGGEPDVAHAFRELRDLLPGSVGIDRQPQLDFLQVSGADDGQPGVGQVPNDNSSQAGHLRRSSKISAA